MAEKRNQQKLGEILVEQGIIAEEQLNEAIEEQKVTGRFLGEILVSRGAVSEERMTQCLSQQLGFAFVDLYEMEIEPKVKGIIPEEVCNRFTAMPLFVVSDTITLAMVNPLDIQAIDEIQNISGYRIRPVFACLTAVRDAIGKHYHGGEEEQPPAGKEEELLPPGKERGAFTDQLASLKQAANLAPVVEMVNNIITRAVEMSASDIHLEPQRHAFNCRYRIDGILYPNSHIPVEEQAAVISRIKIMANMDIAEKRLPQDGRVKMFAAGRDVDLRISSFPTIYGENIVMRILDRSSGILKLEQLGFSKDVVNTFSQLIRRPYGIILVTGPTGSGKTTTLYAALNEINTTEKNIITLEDPVEYELSNVRQSQVNVKAGLTFASGLRSIVRQDPDIIMIGEIRDKETADIAIHAALTGHLVLSTLHTNDAPSAAARLVDMGVEPFLAASSIIGVLAQRLVRTLCPACKQKYSPSAELLSQLGLDINKRERKTTNGRRTTNNRRRSYVFYKESGCRECKERGYIGRTGIYELLMPNDNIKGLITRSASSIALRDAAIEAGMLPLREAGLEKITAGVTSVSEVMRVTEDV
jgi:type IV pilus assembly protein PilB